MLQLGNNDISSKLLFEQILCKAIDRKYAYTDRTVWKMSQNPEGPEPTIYI